MTNQQAFQFLLKHADIGDLEEVRKGDDYQDNAKFRQTIGNALKTAKSAGTRHQNYNAEATSIALNVLEEEVVGGRMWTQEAGTIIGGYLLGEGEAAKEAVSKLRSKRSVKRDCQSINSRA